MRRLAVAAIVVAGLIVPAHAQRSGSRGGGFSGHSGSSFHASSSFRGGFSSSAPRRFAAPPVSFANGPRQYAPSYASGNPAGRGAGTGSVHSHPAYGYNSRQVYGAADHSHRPPYRSPYRRYAPYAYGVGTFIGAPFLGYGFPDYLDTSGDDDAGGPGYAPDYGPDDSAPYPPDQWAAYPPYPQQRVPASAAQALEPGGFVTLIFKDARPPEQIQNYVLTPTTLTVWDGHHRDIPVDQIDVVATEQVNRTLGVDFHFPKGTM